MKANYSKTEQRIMIHQDYDALSLEEKVKRLETCAQLYLGWLDVPDSYLGMREDCTRYWEEMERAARIGK